jgi:hypothetical protein
MWFLNAIRGLYVILVCHPNAGIVRFRILLEQSLIVLSSYILSFTVAYFIMYNWTNISHLNVGRTFCIFPNFCFWPHIIHQLPLLCQKKCYSFLHSVIQVTLTSNFLVVAKFPIWSASVKILGLPSAISNCSHFVSFISDSCMYLFLPLLKTQMWKNMKCECCVQQEWQYNVHLML